MPKFAITCGDVNGVGPEIILKAIFRLASRRRNFFIYIPHNIFEHYRKKLNVDIAYDVIENEEHANGKFNIHICNLGKARLTAGKPSKESGEISYYAILRAVKAVEDNLCDGIVTAPISKEALSMAGINFPGHTELLAHLTATKDYSMVFLSEKMICSLLTIHVPVKNVPKMINKRVLKKNIEILYRVLSNDIGLKNPRIAVLGLNPHAGENALIGKEEKLIIKPVVDLFNFVDGPFPADAFFGAALYKKYDGIVGMYHDQVLIPFKMLYFNTGVNYTANLPIVRTSPDHGTAFDIAGKGVAMERSMVEAILWAEKIIRNRKKNEE
ncbi:4-hydroxythreonine-4-phosphate dehydrogenase PdxA [Melioribacter sp. OK-6-Me]|uniref:4-hydroxythreonine-4-phosphate dehydrogenase PdxA n=1 Tax=unclassified Melioribacter TaxID=2627329 RepID=UPI003ED950EC